MYRNFRQEKKKALVFLVNRGLFKHFVLKSEGYSSRPDWFAVRCSRSIDSLEDTGLAYCSGVGGLYRRLVFLLFEKPLHVSLYLSKLA